MPEPIEESVDDGGKRRFDEGRQGSVEGARGHWHTAEAWFWVQKPSFVLFKVCWDFVGFRGENQQAGATKPSLHCTRQTFCSSQINADMRQSKAEAEVSNNWFCALACTPFWSERVCRAGLGSGQACQAQIELVGVAALSCLLFY